MYRKCLRKNFQRTPQEKAQRAKMSIFARLAGCAYLIYIIYQLLTTPQQGTMDTKTTTIISIVLMVLTVGVIAITVYDFFRGLKSGLFNAATYEDADDFHVHEAEIRTEGAPETGSALEGHSEEDDCRESPADESADDAEQEDAADDTEDNTVEDTAEDTATENRPDNAEH